MAAKSRGGRPRSAAPKKRSYTLKLDEHQADRFDLLVAKRQGEVEAAGGTATAMGVLRNLVLKACDDEGIPVTTGADGPPAGDAGAPAAAPHPGQQAARTRRP